MDALLRGLTEVLAPEAFGLMIVGVAIGFVVGILPGLGGPVTLALMIPFTFGLEPVPAFAFLLGMFVVTGTTGDITSVLFGIPGEATSAATVLDGYPMTKRGEGGRALGAVLFSSLIGAIFGAAFLAITIPFIRPIVLSFGPPEFFAMTVLGLAFIVSLGGQSLAKGFVMVGLGFLVATIGLDPHAGLPRFTFGQLYLLDGINLIPVVVGLFGGAEVIELMLGRGSIAKAPAVGTVSGLTQGIRDTLIRLPLTLRSSAIGVGVSVVPGLGGVVAQFIAYGQAKQMSKDPDSFGRGSIEGVIAAGAVNNSKEGGALVPTLAFGIPGSGAMAILLSAFVITGLIPGPDMLTTHLDVTYAMVWIMVIANILAVGLSFLLARHIARLAFVRGALLVPFLLTMLALGAFTTNNSLGDIVVMLVFTIGGVICLRLDWPRIPFLLAFVLGPTAERYLFLSHQLYGIEWLVHPLVLLILGLALFGVMLPAVRRWKSRRGLAKAPGQGHRSSSRPFYFSDIAVALVLSILFVAAISQATDLPFRSALFPRLAAGFGVIMSAGIGIVLLTDRLRTAKLVSATDGAAGLPVPRGPVQEADTESNTQHDLQFDSGQAFTVASPQVWLETALWWAAYFASIWLLGLVTSAALFAFAYLRFVGRERIWACLAYAAAMWSVIELLFVRILHIRLPDGLLF